MSEAEIYRMADYCRCGRRSHPCYGSRCEDCYADGMEHAIGHKAAGLLIIGVEAYALGFESFSDTVLPPA